MMQRKRRYTGSIQESSVSKRTNMVFGRNSTPSPFRCDECDRNFTTRRALLRHNRETQKHSSVNFRCSLCPRTCTRLFDLRRHEVEQHPEMDSNGRSSGIVRRSTLPPDEQNQHGQSASSEEVVAEEILSTASHEAPIGHLPSILGELLPTWVRDTISNRAGVNKSYDHVQQSTHLSWLSNHRTSFLGITCGHCGGKFESERRGDLIKHLSRHRDELNESHPCETCAISFIRREDLAAHQTSVESSGSCGFVFHHLNPCTGHHPPNDIDRANFYVRITDWEQSQLQRFTRSVQGLFDPDSGPLYHVPSRSNTGADIMVPHPRTHTEPSDIDYESKMKSLASGLGNLDLGNEPSTPANPDEAINCLAVHQAANDDNVGKLTMLPPESLRFIHTHNCLGQTPLHTAVLAGALHAAQHLINCGNTLELRNIGGTTALEVALISGQLGAARLLLQNGARTTLPDQRGRSLIHRLVATKNAAAVSLILDIGVNVNARDNDGRSPLYFAIRAGSYKIAQLLMQHGASSVVEFRRFISEHPAFHVGA